MTTRTALLTRVKGREGQTLHFTMPATTRQRAAVEFIQPQHVPEFEGDEAWFELEKVPSKPWPYWRAVRRVEGPGANEMETTR